MERPNLRIVFAGTPEFAAAHLKAVISSGFSVVSAYSQPDRPTGRGKHVLPTPVKAMAMEKGIPVHQPLSLDSPEAQARLRELQPDVMVVVAYGLLLPPAILELPRYGCLNVHTSLLPRWRGAAPIERAIMAGDTQTGVSVMQMDAGLDSGPILGQVSLPTLEENSLTLGNRLCDLGCKALCAALDSLPDLLLTAQRQDESQATYAKKIAKAEALIDWSLAAASLHNLVRALYPRAPAYCQHQDKRLRIIEARALSESSSAMPGTIIRCSPDAIDVACGSGSLRLLRVQQEGKNEMSIASLLNGHPGYFKTGMQLGGA